MKRYLMHKGALILLVVVMLLLLSLAAQAHRYYFSFIEQVRDSDLIITAEVVEIDKTFLGEKFASLRPIEYIKGQSSSDTPALRYGDPFASAQEDSTFLEEGKRCVFFLKSSGNVYYSMGEYHIDEQENVRFEGKALPAAQFVEKIKRYM